MFSPKAKTNLHKIVPLNDVQKLVFDSSVFPHKVKILYLFNVTHGIFFFFIVFLCLMDSVVFHQKLLKVTTIDLYKIVTSNFGQNVVSYSSVFLSQQWRHQATHFF